MSLWCVQVLLQLVTWLEKFQRENKPGVQTTAKLKKNQLILQYILIHDGGMKHNNTLWKQKQLILFLFQKNNKMQEVWYLFRSLITINQYFQLTQINSLVLNDSSYCTL